MFGSSNQKTSLGYCHSNKVNKNVISQSEDRRKGHMIGSSNQKTALGYCHSNKVNKRVISQLDGSTFAHDLYS